MWDGAMMLGGMGIERTERLRAARSLSRTRLAMLAVTALMLSEVG